MVDAGSGRHMKNMKDVGEISGDSYPGFGARIS
jgi:hypothetical protein